MTSREFREARSAFLLHLKWMNSSDIAIRRHAYRRFMDAVEKLESVCGSSR